MIEIYTGNDRVRAKAKIQKTLGDNYEVIDAVNLTPADLPSIFLGASLFAETRNILIRDFSENKSIFDELPKYLNTPHKIILFETKLDKRSTTYKIIKDKIKIEEFTLPEKTDFNFTYSIYKIAKTDGKRAVKMLEEIKNNEEPIRFCGLLISQALKDFGFRQGIKEKKILKALSELDMNLKSTSIDGWLLIETFLLQLSTI